MVIQILLAIAVLLAGVLVFAATRPGSFRIERSAVVKASPEKIFPHIDDFHRWPMWSPWENVDPALKRTYSGAAAGKGAAYAWEGNKNVGSGQMEITDSTPSSKIVIKLDFLKPFEAHNMAEFTLTPGAQGTTVTWAMFGPSPFASKLMGVFMNMDRMVGSQFELGLANLKRISEN